MNNNKDNKEFVMPNGFKITGNMGSGQKCWPKKVLAMG
jgi:hypothetical protein